MGKFEETKAFLQELNTFLGVLHNTDASEVEWEKEGYGFKVSFGARKKGDGEPPSTNGKQEEASSLVQISSPVVGTFHFLEKSLELGMTVNPKFSLGYVKSVNVKHTIEADAKGKLFAVHVEEGDPVEFGQVLFVLEPADVS